MLFTSCSLSQKKCLCKEQIEGYIGVEKRSMNDENSFIVGKVKNSKCEKIISKIHIIPLNLSLDESKIIIETNPLGEFNIKVIPGQYLVRVMAKEHLPFTSDTLRVNRGDIITLTFCINKNLRN